MSDLLVDYKSVDASICLYDEFKQTANQLCDGFEETKKTVESHGGSSGTLNQGSMMIFFLVGILGDFFIELSMIIEKYSKSDSDLANFLGFINSEILGYKTRETRYNFKHHHDELLIHTSENKMAKFEEELENAFNRSEIAGENALKFIKDGNNFDKLEKDEWNETLNWWKNYQQVLAAEGGYSFLGLRELILRNSDIKSKGFAFTNKGQSSTAFEDYLNGKMWCTTYAAARRTQIGKPLPEGPFGDANDWIQSAKDRGLIVSKTPSEGDVFSIAGKNHVGVVERVFPNGDIEISEGNFDGNGSYRFSKITHEQYKNWQFIK